MRGETLKGHMEMLLLAVVQRRPAHGYAIIEALRRRSAGDLDLAEGTIYPVLHRLERAGLLASRWDDSPGERRRRVYSLTGVGRKALAEQSRSWKQFVRAVNAVLEPVLG